jgi:hypothetical protein
MFRTLIKQPPSRMASNSLDREAHWLNPPIIVPILLVVAIILWATYRAYF